MEGVVGRYVSNSKVWWKIFLFLPPDLPGACFFPLIVPDRRVMIGCFHNRQTKLLVCVFSPLKQTGQQQFRPVNYQRAWMRGSIMEVWDWWWLSGELFRRIWRVSCNEVMAKAEKDSPSTSFFKRKLLPFTHQVAPCKWCRMIDRGEGNQAFIVRRTLLCLSFMPSYLIIRF